MDVNHSQLFAHPVNGRGGAVGVDRQAGVGEGGGHEAVGRQLDPGGPGLADVHYGRAELVEVPGRQVPEEDVPEDREDDRLGRPPGLVEGLRGAPASTPWARHSSSRVRTVAVGPEGSTAATSSRRWSSALRASVWFFACTVRVTWRGWPVAGSVPTKTRSRYRPSSSCWIDPVPLGRRR